MSQVVKVLEKRSVIRLFGISLFLAPIINTWVSILTATTEKHHFTFRIFWKVATTGTVFDHLLNVASMIIGIVMLRGHLTAWRYALLLLGMRILFQVATFGTGAKSHWVSGAFLFINIIFFLFIADQLVFKVKLKPEEVKKKPKEAAQSQKSILVHFDGIGPWAQLTAITPQGIGVKCFDSPPPDIGAREVEVVLKNGLTLRMKLARQSGEEFFFQYKDLKPEDVKRLNEWVARQAA